MKKLSLLTVLIALILTGCAQPPPIVSAESGDRFRNTPVPSTPVPMADDSIPSAPPPAVNKIEQKVGVVETEKDQIICLRIKNPSLAEQTPVLIFDTTSDFDGTPQKTFQATVEKKLEKNCALHDSDAGEIDLEQTSYYSLKLNDEKDKSGVEIGIAVINPAKSAHLDGKKAGLDINADGKTEFFRTCASTEGLHLTVWTGKPLKGKRIWHSYYYLHYDTERTCDEKDWEET
jgi:hypothetical protein